MHREPHDPEADRAALEQLAEWCEQFSPIVGLETSDEPSSLFLDATGLGPLFGGEGALSRQITESFQRRGYAIHTAIADTIGAAWAALHTPFSPHSELLTPNSSLPVQALRLPEETIELLREWLKQLEPLR